MDTTKTCRRCGTTYDNTYCRTCARTYYEANKDLVKARAKQWAKDNPAKIAAKKARRAAANPELAKEKAARRRAKYSALGVNPQQEWRHNNPEKYKAQRKRYRDKHPEKFRCRDGRRRAKTLGGHLSNNLIGVLFKKQKGICPCCGKPLGVDFHLDHITPLAKGGAHADWNMQLMRSECNIEKSDQDPESFMWKRGFDGYVAPSEPM